ncbi:TonB family C-terminal domain-containing protein [Abditibacterium utsteinense]|uniref:TonB family C-terminal domain-containing protein n=1 Tax=Abditibacterium utsteinense TaxID=1960156 RepID=A0A2S8SV51_9BACT|nr:TonB family protein [Abditibacterium utsteinense]PQV64670.1 TonB family C-terminal domain-containing protein [Abditibacterium utsteinense]
MNRNLESDKKRLGAALIASFFVNMILWRAVGGAISGQKVPPAQNIEISRLILTPQIQKSAGKKAARKVAFLPKNQRVSTPETRRAKPEKPQQKTPLRPRVRQNSPISPRARSQRAPFQKAPITGTRIRVLVAENPIFANAGEMSAGGKTALSRANASQGSGSAETPATNNAAPISKSSGNSQSESGGSAGKLNSAESISPRPSATSIPLPTATPFPVPTRTPQPEPTATPKPQPTATPIPFPTRRPEPTSTPKPAGPTRAARATRQVQPDIPDELKNGEFKTSVRVTVEIGADGSSSASLRSSSGNAAIDARVLAALRRWKWKPALQDGEPVASTQRFRFDFVVR